MKAIVTRALCLLVLMLAWTGTGLAQERTVTGTVVDAESNLPLPGVNVVIAGTSQGTTTNLDGEYTLQVPGPESVLNFSFVGYRPEQIEVGDQEVIDVVLQEDVARLEDVVVVGYGTQRRGEVTGSVSTIDADDANLGLVTSPDQMLQGRVAGVQLTSNNGEPGAGFNIRIRGGTSISASNEPLYVVDGVPIDNSRVSPGGSGVSGAATRNPMAMLNPNDIESITILKDASATAIYGSRAANGVILIETKRGAEGTVQVDYEGFVSASNAYKKLDLLTGPEYRGLIEEAVDDGAIAFRDEDNNGVADALDRLGDADTDWQDAIMQTGWSQSHNLALSGGATNTNYRASLSYLNNEGIVVSSGFERITGRINADHDALGDRLHLGLNLQTSYVNNDYAPYQQTGGFTGGLFTNVFGFNPTYPLEDDLDQDGVPEWFEVGTGAQDVRNPLALARQIEDFDKVTRSLGNLSAELDLFEGLSARVSVGADRRQASRRLYFPAGSPVGAQWNGRAEQRSRELTTKTFQSYLTYARGFGVHNFNLLGGYEFNEYTVDEFGAEARDFVTDFWKYNNLGGGKETIKPFSLKEENRLVSFFTRGRYNFQDRYFIEGVLRYDGSSRFGLDNKWALFPAVSLGWRLSDEAFMSGVDWVSNLHLRAGYGRQGNQEIGNYNSLALLRPDEGARAVIGDEIVTGVAPVTFANPNLKWEEAEQYNVGIDYGFLAGRINGSLEYYIKNTYDLLLDIPVPQPSVVSTRIENIGEIRNEGIEFALDALAVDRQNFSLFLGGVFAANTNEVESLGTRERIFTGSVSGRGQSGVQSMIIVPGEPLGAFYGPVFTGINDEGVQTFADLDGDGLVEEGTDDRKVIGFARPDFTYGFNAQAYYGNFDLSMNWYGEYGAEVFNNTALVFQTKSSAIQNQNLFAAALEDADALREAPKFSSRWIEDASFLRLQNVTLGYTMDLSTMTNYANQARLFLSVDNLWLLTDYSGYDPEVNTGNTGLAARGIDYTNYPRPRTFSLGVHLSF